MKTSRIKQLVSFERFTEIWSERSGDYPVIQSTKDEIERYRQLSLNPDEDLGDYEDMEVVVEFVDILCSWINVENPLRYELAKSVCQ